MRGGVCRNVVVVLHARCMVFMPARRLGLNLHQRAGRRALHGKRQRAPDGEQQGKQQQEPDAKRFHGVFVDGVDGSAGMSMRVIDPWEHLRPCPRGKVKRKSGPREKA